MRGLIGSRHNIAHNARWQRYAIMAAAASSLINNQQ